MAHRRWWPRHVPASMHHMIQSFGYWLLHSNYKWHPFSEKCQHLITFRFSQSKHGCASVICKSFTHSGAAEQQACGHDHDKFSQGTNNHNCLNAVLDVTQYDTLALLPISLEYCNRLVQRLVILEFFGWWSVNYRADFAQPRRLGLADDGDKMCQLDPFKTNHFTDFIWFKMAVPSFIYSASIFNRSLGAVCALIWMVDREFQEFHTCTYYSSCHFIKLWVSKYVGLHSFS